ATPKELVKFLDHPDAWWRTTAQRLLLERPESADVEAIETVARSSRHPAARLQALWALEPLGKLESVRIIEALDDRWPGLRETALMREDGRLKSEPDLAAAVLEMADDPDPSVRFQLAFTLGEHPSPKRVEALATLARRDADDRDARAAILSSVGDDGL